MQRMIEFLVGLLFGLGLILSGMTDPGKVLGFLDLTGAWDPSLALVMGGAVAVGLLAFRLARQRERNLLGGDLHLPPRRTLTPRLVWGSLVFGAGWGLAGYCPGPALVSMASGQTQGLVFVAAMLAGLLLYRLLDRFRIRATTATAQAE